MGGGPPQPPQQLMQLTDLTNEPPQVQVLDAIHRSFRTVKGTMFFHDHPDLMAELNFITDETAKLMQAVRDVSRPGMPEATEQGATTSSEPEATEEGPEPER